MLTDGAEIIFLMRRKDRGQWWPLTKAEKISYGCLYMAGAVLWGMTLGWVVARISVYFWSVSFRDIFTVVALIPILRRGGRLLAGSVFPRVESKVQELVTESLAKMEKGENV
jgi:hypothetical protein